jgi:hypothetical protein
MKLEPFPPVNESWNVPSDAVTVMLSLLPLALFRSTMKSVNDSAGVTVRSVRLAGVEVLKISACPWPSERVCPL